MTEELPEEWNRCLLQECKDFKKFKELIQCLDDINKCIIKSELNSLNLLHICVGIEPEEFGHRCVEHLLSKARADINRLAKIYGNFVTSAHIAIDWKRYSILDLLIKYGIDLFVCDSNGDTAQEYADKNGDNKAFNTIERALKDCHRRSSFRPSMVSYSVLKERDNDSNIDNKTDLDETIICFDENQWTNFRDKCVDSSVESNSSDNSLKSNISYEKTDSIKSFSSDKTEVYVYNDKDYNVVLIEERFEGCADTSDEKIKTIPNHKDCTEEIDLNHELAQIEAMNSTAIFTELRQWGDSPRPVTDSTKKICAKRILKYRTRQLINNNVLPLPAYSEELNLLIQNRFPFENAQRLEEELTKSLDNKGLKQYFNYILMDPNICEDVVLRASKNMINNGSAFDVKCFTEFVRSIFYVGKGHANRVYEHFYEAVQSDESNKTNKSPKVEQILNIWSNGKGVISLHCFHDSCSAEALAREAIIIEALGISNLTNKQSGQKIAELKRNRFKTETNRRICGSYLLYKAFNIYVMTGERQIRRPNPRGL